MAVIKLIRKVTFYIAALACLAAIVYVGRGWFYGAATIRELLTENKQLKTAITNLTFEDQIGYAKVISQENRDGKLFTNIKFVETAREDKLKKVLEKTYAIEGDIVHFDALVVKFGDKMVMDGEEKALYLWRRVYGENTAPENGLMIEEPGEEPQRYKDLLNLLPEKEKSLFWTNVWELANNSDRLREYDIKAVYGNVVYSKLRKGLIYVFKISPSGQLYPETVPDMYE
ncbi:MAG: hypothetical protein PHQ35_01795 [Phycisphaerae bacterium]|nr:hypothetical protein [Phycisphaerae bacterium]MDD5380378.1 hypothetical protein [Phycisphaerae bacterium]